MYTKRIEGERWIHTECNRELLAAVHGGYHGDFIFISSSPPKTPPQPPTCPISSPVSPAQAGLPPAVLLALGRTGDAQHGSSRPACCSGSTAHGRQGPLQLRLDLAAIHSGSSRHWAQDKHYWLQWPTPPGAKQGSTDKCDWGLLMVQLCLCHKTFGIKQLLCLLDFVLICFRL